ncbi:GTP-binding protein Era [Flavobacterium tiangeerense]|uniref:GTP-binding protein Era n=1 Tax=Flavobacterium tiangeerense TaxID=459471 RepID=A0ABY3FKX5_9FLAO|nr:GTPase [Flavobacterium tiangeerense]TWI00428.1 GTP-binding protein Era [Flavobacterium tiangeerense]
MENNEFDQKSYEDAFKRSYDETHTEFENISNQKLIISLIGSVNAGKSKTINTLTGIDYTEVKARSGWTKEVSLYELNKGVFVADTPGLFDIDADISKKASDFVANSADIILYFLNAGVGITKHEKKAFEEIAALGKQTLVVLNKIDSLEQNEVTEVINQIKEELGIFPIPISSKTGEGIQNLNNEIVKILEANGKDLMFLKISKFKEQSVKKWINAATAAAFGIGALPIPGSDIIALSALQTGLAFKIAYIYDIKPTKEDIMSLVASTVTGSIGKQVVRWGITTLKAVGWIPGAQLLEVATMAIAASIAASLTYAFGWASNAYYKSGMALDLGEVGKIFNEKYEMYKKEKEPAKV